MESITRLIEILTSTNTTSLNYSSQFGLGIVEVYSFEELPQPRTVPGRYRNPSSKFSLVY
jgi:hypothetical protein